MEMVKSSYTKNYLQLGIKKIEGLQKCMRLRSLYLHENCIEKIENLEKNKAVVNLNLSTNCIETIENLGNLKPPQLTIIQITCG